MFKKKFAAVLAAIMAVACLSSCGEQTGDEGKKPNLPDVEFVAADYANLPTVQLSSVQAVETSGSCKLKMKAPWSDTYHITFSKNAVKTVAIFDEAGKMIAGATENFDVTLTKGQVVNVYVEPVKTSVRFTVKGTENSQPLPFDVGEAPDPASFSTTSADPTVDPLEPATINYVKRKNTKYIYSNAPETLVQDVVNKCITRQDVTNESVFFTFEHQSREVENPVYYGYRVTNTSETDVMYVTVKNVGFQLSGKGAYMGEKEWMDFYRYQFELPDFTGLTESEYQLYEDYINFGGEYMVTEFQPTTYRIPAGEYMYVIGGTTVDAYAEINVANTANRKSINAVVENGAVLFDVVGKAEGAFYIYDDVTEVMPGGAGCDTHLGGTSQPDASCGWDEGYVVDNQATWIFNDATPAHEYGLPVTYTNYYNEDLGEVAREHCTVKGTPNTPIEGTTSHVQNRDYWATHLDVQQKHDCVGTDVALFHTVDLKGNPVVYGCNYWDSEGKLPNMGSWMKDYQDVFTFVNQGDKARTVRLNAIPNGAMPVMLRSMDGKLILEEGLKPFYAMHYAAFERACHYEIVIPPHSVKQYVLEYNLMANSSGYMSHSVDLI